MPDNEAERPTTATPKPAVAGDASSDPTTTGTPKATVRHHRQRSHRSARTRLVRRRSARRMQNSNSTTPVQPRQTRRRQHTEASSTGPGPRRRTRSQRLANGTRATQRPTNRPSTTAHKPAGRRGTAPSSNGSVNGSVRRSRRSTETELQPASHTGGRKASRLTRSANYRVLGKDTPTIEPVAASLGRPLQLTARRWSSLGTTPSGRSALASGATYRALGRSGGSAEHTDPTEASGTAVYRSLGRSSLPMHRAQSPLHQSNAAKSRSISARPTRRSRLRRASQRPRPSRANAASRSDD